jgi:hypothetical protein
MNQCPSFYKPLRLRRMDRDYDRTLFAINFVARLVAALRGRLGDGVVTLV